MRNWRTTYWNMFNAFGRVVGVGFAVVGSVVCLYGIAQRDWVMAAASAVVVILGILLVMARPWRPPGV